MSLETDVRPPDEVRRAERLHQCGFAPEVADRLAVLHDVTFVRVATTADEDSKWWVRVIA